MALAVRGEISKLLRRKGILVGDQTGDGSEAKRASLVVGEAKLEGVEPPIRAEVDQAMIVVERLRNTSRVSHQPAKRPRRAPCRGSGRWQLSRHSARPGSQACPLGRLCLRQPCRSDDGTGHGNSRSAEKVSATSIMDGQDSASSLDFDGGRRNTCVSRHQTYNTRLTVCVSPEYTVGALNPASERAGAYGAP